MNLVESLRAHRLLAIVRGKDPEAALRTVRTLAESGIEAVEVSLTTTDALEVIRRARAELGPAALLGAGTVRSATDAARAVDAGASYLVTPALVDGLAAYGVPVLMGALTPTEVEAALARGADAIKLFPGSFGGPGYLKALRDPFPEVPFVPVGGVDAAAARDYLDRGAIAVGVGSPLVGDAADGGDLGQLRARAAEFRKVAAGGDTVTTRVGQAATDVVTFGETMAALRAHGALRLGGSLGLSVAGAESNVAIGLARLGHRVRWAGRVGADELGALVLRTLRAEGVDIDHAVTDDTGRPTGLLLTEPRLGTLTRVSYYRAGSAGSAVSPADVLPALAAGARILHLTGITPALSASAAEAAPAAAAAARDAGVTVCLDVNFRSRLWTTDEARTALRPLLERTDLLIASEDELPLVLERPGAAESEAVRGILAAGVAEVVVKRGARGATSFTADGATDRAARQVEAVDLVGAGDAFVAGYLSGVLDGADVPARLHRAVTTAAFAVATRGDWEGLPTRDELGLLDEPDGTTIR